MDLRLSDVARTCRGRLEGPDVVAHGVTIDSRLVRGGELFVPIAAARDGHDFVRAALDAGAAGYLTSRAPVGGSAVVVGDTAAALDALAAHARDLLGGATGPAGTGPAAGRVVGVTGSVGKTSVKDLLRAALGARWRTWASAGSHNNELGVPLTLLNAPGDTQALVVEMGARGLGHIADLCALARPTIGVVTRVVAAHTQTFGTIDDVAAAKGELVEALPAHGTAVLNAGDPRVAALARRTQARVVRFGDGGDVRAEDLVLDDELRPSFRLVGDWGTAVVRLEVRGAHMVDNALAAAAAALVCDVPLAALPGALAGATLSPWRMEVVRLPGGTRVVNDAYNANPTSMTAALRSLAALPAQRRVAVLGLMAELGIDSDAEHRAIGKLAADLGVEVVGVGLEAYGGRVVDSVDEVPAALGELGPDDAVLVKGSRSAGLERVVDLLLT